MHKTHLVVIDPQNSFCKVVDAQEQQVIHDGELCVPGAWEDMECVAQMISRLGKKLDDIHITLDSHHQLHIAHPIWWKDSGGTSPVPFTALSEQSGTIQGSDGKEYTTYRPSFLKRTLEYLKALSDGKRYPHVIWPPHCLIGTPGHNIVTPLLTVVLQWERDVFGAADIVTKGSNYFVEHFSAVRAEVIDPQDPTTQLNTAFVNTVMEADEILLSGEASSHCLANTVRDMANEFADDSFIKKCVLLTDGTSAVPTFENYEQQFIQEMTSRGMKTTTTVDYLA